MGQHVVECCGAPVVFNYKIIDQCKDSEKLMTIEALHISRRKPQLNTQDNYKSTELTLKCEVQNACSAKKFLDCHASKIILWIKTKTFNAKFIQKKLTLQVLKFF